MNIRAEILNNMIYTQLKDIPRQHLLSFKDLQRIAEGLPSTINDSKCVIWDSYFISRNQQISYVPFFHKKKKKNLLRLLYMNFVGQLDDNEYIHNICGQKLCCNVKHCKIKADKVTKVRPQQYEKKIKLFVKAISRDEIRVTFT
jgi:hypothetical protein